MSSKFETTAQCTICETRDVKKCYLGHPGYIESTTFDIYCCKQCDSHFVLPSHVDEKLYSIIYSSTETPGYERYRTYANKVKSSKHPLKYLSDTEASYFPVYKHLNSLPRLNILEVGCSYGYLTFALNSIGHNAFGIDISDEAIQFAKNNFGDYYKRTDITSIKEKIPQKLDVIIAIELIEHLAEPGRFIKQCLDILNANGKIIISTPNKDYAPKGITWQTDYPPVHMAWLSHQSFNHIAKTNNLNLSFVDYSIHYPSRENKLITYFMNKNKLVPSLPILSKDGKPIGRWTTSPLAKMIRKLFVDFLPIRIFSNFLFNKFCKEHRVLSLILSKKHK